MEQTLETQKHKAAMLSVISNSTLILLKLFAGFITGSIGIISEAIHSGSDLLASILTLFSVNESSKPADKDHQFGHGKYEDFTSLIEGFLIILAALYIVYESVKKIMHASNIEMDVNIGLAVMFISVIANVIVSSHLFKIAKKSDSAALYADAEHLRTDIYSSAAVLMGLFCVKLTGNVIYDPIIAIIVAIIIFIAGFKICDRAKDNLLDSSLSENEKSQINAIIHEYIDEGINSLKSLRTRKSGVKKNIIIVLSVDKNMTVGDSHNICDKIEAEIESALGNTDVFIHIEPI